jgi:L-aspartate oxidase
MEMNRLAFDFVIVGCGLAGTAAALELCQWGDVAVVSKEPVTGCNSYWAQGGIAAAVDHGDSVELHVADTLNAGHGLCHPAVVADVAGAAPDRVRWLERLGVSFDVDGKTGRLSLGLEGAHSRRRILHAGGDASGKNVMLSLHARLGDELNIVHLNHHAVNSLLVDANGRVAGVLATDANSGEELWIRARRGTVLATGGAGQLYARTTNPPGSTGDGIALAHSVGATVRNLEFVQFHPTALDADCNPRFLISEAVRGAGAHLVYRDGRRLMAFHPMQDLAPRDVIARTIYESLQRGEPVYLDARKVDDFQARFPTIFNGCLARGYNPERDLLPVAPAAHFMMGGVEATLAGETCVPGLYAVGEVSSTGLHGANRLASNSLLECLVMAHQLSLVIQDAEEMPLEAPDSLQPVTRFTTPPPELLSQVQDVMWTCAGIVRDGAQLQHGLSNLLALQDRYPHAAAVYTALLVVQSALLREESRGAHYRSDFPKTESALDCVDTRLQQPCTYATVPTH